MKLKAIIVSDELKKTKEGQVKQMEDVKEQGQKDINQLKDLK